MGIRDHALFTNRVLQTKGAARGQDQRPRQAPCGAAHGYRERLERLELMCRLRHHHRQLRPASQRQISHPSASAFCIKLWLRQGLVFAACVGQPKLHLFDTRNYAKGTAVFELLEVLCLFPRFCRRVHLLRPAAACARPGR